MFGLPIEVIVSLISLVLGWFGEQKKQQQADIHEQLMAAKDSANDAAKSMPSGIGAVLRMFVASIIILVAFGGLLYVSDSDKGVTQFFEKEPWLNLFGLIKLGGGVEAISATGFVLPDYVKYSVLSIVHFLFGMAAGKR